jgi:hypothetical protein
LESINLKGINFKKEKKEKKKGKEKIDLKNK